MTEPLSSPAPRYLFGVFELDAAALELRKHDRVVRVRPQSLKLLTLLLEKPGEVVSRDEIQRALWGDDTFVDFEQGVNHAIRELRAVIGDSADSPRFIRTFARRGYGFIAPVTRSAAGVATPPVAAPDVLPAASGDVSAAPPPAPSSSAAVGLRQRWLTTAGLSAVVALVAVAVLLMGWTSGADDDAPAPPIAVVPFATSDIDPALGVGLANAIAQRLGTETRALVRSTPPPSSSTLSPNVQAHADVRGATVVLSGDVSRKDDAIGVTARLENVSTGKVLWTERFQLHASTLHDIEQVIVERVVNALNLRLAAANQERIRRRYTENGAAYEDYLRGRALLVRYTPDSTLDAIRAFESAIQRDPGYALARAGLAMACADMCLRFASTRDVDHWGQRAESEARAALDLDANLAEAHLARAAVARKREFDWNEVIVSSRRALVLNPNLEQAHFFIAAAYSHTGYMEEAAIEVQSGQRLRGPDALEPIRLQGITALWSGDFAPATVHFEEVSRLSDRAIADTYLAQAYYYSGRVEQGRTMLESLVTSSSASTASRAGAALASVIGGKNPAAARDHIERVLKRDYRDHHVAYNLGAAYAQVGEATAATQWLRTAADTGFPCLAWFERDPLLDPLRRDPKFADLLDYVRSKRKLVLN